jgi:hypothetical protein
MFQYAVLTLQKPPFFTHEIEMYKASGGFEKGYPY